MGVYWRLNKVIKTQKLEIEDLDIKDVVRKSIAASLVETQCEYFRLKFDYAYRKKTERKLKFQFLRGEITEEEYKNKIEHID